MHEMMASHHQEKSDQDMLQSFQQFLNARSSRRFEPIWANQSQSERLANLKDYHAQRQSERRRARAFGSTTST